MAFSEICRICLSVNVRMIVLKTGLQNFYKTLTNSFIYEDEGPIIVCFTCHARLIRCRRLQQQAIESNAVLEQLLAGGSMSLQKPHKARDVIQFTPICHIDIMPIECDKENDCKDETFVLESIKVEEENVETENFKFEENWNHKTETSGKGEDLQVDAFGDRYTASEDDLPLIAFGSKSKEKSKTVKLKKKRRNNKKDDDDIEQCIKPTNNFSEPFEKKNKSTSTDSKINGVHKENLDFESPTIKSNPEVKKGIQPINKNRTKILKKKTLKQKSVNRLKKKTSGASTKYIFECDGCSRKFSTKDILAKHISHSHKTQKYLDSAAIRTQVEHTSVRQITDIFNCDICEFKTSEKRCILAHLKAHVAKKMYCCNICEYKCIHKGHLQTHVKSHTGEKPFSCNICDYKCIRKASLRRHIKIHTREKPFSCHICEYKCIRKYQLHTHIKSHTGEKPYSCHICKYKCIRKVDLRTHIKLHSGGKHYSCHICDYKCIRKAYLRRHIKIHTGEKPYSCHICEYKCIQKSNLQKHMKIHTAEKPFS